LQVELNPSTPLDDPGRRNRELSKWIVLSDDKCNKYLLQLSRGIRDSRLATDVVATVLSGLATILAPVGTKTALSGAATITLGVGGDLQSDLFAQQAGEVLISAVQTVRTRARLAMSEKMQARYADYTLEQGFVDVQRYDQETCNLNAGLNELRASLITGPEGRRPNIPILPLPPTSPVNTLPPPFVGPPTVSNAVPREDLPTPKRRERTPVQAPSKVTPGIFDVAPPGPNVAMFIQDRSVPYSPPQIEKIFAVLCVLPTEINDAMSANTKARIKAFQQWFNSDPDPAKPMPSGTGQLTQNEITFLLGQPDCERTRFQNIYEANFLRGVGNKPRDINSPALIDAMNGKLAEPKLAKNATVKDMRSRIPELREVLKDQLVLKDNALSDQLTKDFVAAIMGGR